MFPPAPPPTKKAAGPKAKQISQDTFNDAVQENIEEFEMSPEEAVQDAIEQFEMSGINLSNIIKCPMGDGIDGAGCLGTHPVLDLLTKIRAVDDTSDGAAERMRTALKCLMEECKKDPEASSIAGSNGAVAAIISLIKCNGYAKELKSDALRALTVICTKNDKNRGLFSTFGEGAGAVAKTLLAHVAEPAIQMYGYNLIQCVCTKNSQNADQFADNKILPHVLATLKAHASDAKVMTAVSGAIWELARGDGSMQSKAPQYAKFLAEEECTTLLLTAIKKHAKDFKVVAACCRALEVVAVNDTTCKEAAGAGGVQLLMDLLLAGRTLEGPVCRTASALSCLARNDTNKGKIGVGSELVLSIMGLKAHLSRPHVQIQCLKLLTAITLRQPAICSQLMKQEAHMAVATAMRMHTTSASVQRQGCLLLRNIVSRDKKHCKPILAAGVERLIRIARQKHTSCEDVAFGALRDLGCDISEMKHYRDTGRAMYGGYMPDSFHASTTRSSGADSATSERVYESIRDAAKSTGD